MSAPELRSNIKKEQTKNVEKVHAKGQPKKQKKQRGMQKVVKRRVGPGTGILTALPNESIPVSSSLTVESTNTKSNGVLMPQNIVPVAQTSSHIGVFNSSTKALTVDVAQLMQDNILNTKWDGLVKRTMEHPHYGYFFSFDEKDGGWIASKPAKTNSKKQFPTLVALDCEMCVTYNPTTSQRNSKALIRVSLIDGENPEKTLLDMVVRQPEPGFQIHNYKTDIHGITPEAIESSTISVRDAQKKILKFISKETIVVGHSVYSDLASLRLRHYRAIDTALIFRRKGDSTGLALPGLKDLASALFNLDMPSSHDSLLDAAISLKAAAYARDYGPQVVAVRRVLKNERNQLRVHRIAASISTTDIENFFKTEAHIVPVIVETISWKDAQTNGRSTRFGSTKVIFATAEHADLAYATITGDDQKDTIGREEKSVRILDSLGKIHSKIKVGKMEVSDDTQVSEVARTRQIIGF